MLGQVTPTWCGAQQSTVFHPTCGACSFPRYRSLKAAGQHLDGRKRLKHDSRGANVHVCRCSASNGKPEEIFNAKDFNLALAATLGACSFEAYNAPYVMHGVKEVDDNHSETVYMHRPFLDRIMVGVLQVHVRRAENLTLPKNKDGKEQYLNPQIMVSVGPSCGFSTLQKGTTDPFYGETMFLYVRHPNKEPLRVRLMHNTRKPDVEDGELGGAYFHDIADLCDGESHELELDLEGDDGSVGKVFLSVEFLQHTDDDDALTNLPVRATGQMVSDDWGWGVPEDDWYNPTDYEWRSREIKAESLPVHEDKNEAEQEGYDITGVPAGSGEPLDRPTWKLWKGLREAVATRKLCSTFEPFAFLAHVPTDTEAWVYVNDSHEIVISFRGTSTPADMLKDAVFDLAAFSPGDRPKSHQPEEVAEKVSDEELEEGAMGGALKFAYAIDSIPFVPQLGRLLAATFRSKGRGSTVQGKPPLSGWAKSQALMVYSYEHNERWVHNGFLQSYIAVKKPLLRLLNEIMDVGDNKPWHIYLTGHSMGGALATLAAYELSAIEYKKAPKPELTVYTFGSPRVGNIPFAEDYDKQVPDTWRVANENDLVAKIPSLLGYRHVGIEAKITAAGHIHVARVSFDQVREGAVFSDIMPRIKEGLWGKDQKLKAEFKELIKGEWEVSQAIMRGHAIAEHMEDKYHDILKACVDAGGDKCEPLLKEVDEAMQAA